MVSILLIALLCRIVVDQFEQAMVAMVADAKQSGSDATIALEAEKTQVRLFYELN
jgi:hypothetical protein